MSFKSEAAKVKSNIAAGAYKEKTNVWGGFFDEFAYGLKKQDEEERQERLEARREARTNARRIKAKQDAQDKQDQKDTKLTTLWINSNAVDPTKENINAVLGMVKDGGFSNYTELSTFMKKSSKVIEGKGVSQVTPVPAPIVPNPLNDLSGKIATRDDGTPAILYSDRLQREKEIDKTNNTVRPRSDMIQFGVQPDDVKDMDIDAVRFELSDTTISEERREELTRRLDSLTEPKTYEKYTLFHPDGRTVVARSAEEEAQYREQGYGAEKSAKPPDWLNKAVTTTNIASFTASVDAALKGLPDGDPRRVPLLERKLHIESVASMQADADKRNVDFKLTDNYVTLTLKPDDNGVSRDIRVQLTDQGKFFDITTQDFINPDTVETRGPSSKQVNTSVNAANKFNQHFGNKLSQIKEDTVTLLKTAKQLDDLVLNNRDILTFVGGDATAFLTGLEKEIQTLSSTIGSKQLSSSQVEAALMAKGQKYAQSQATTFGMASNTDAFYKWTALNLRHAFSFAKLDLDSAGMALSNMDFKNALTINNVGKEYATYSGNLKTQTNSVVEKALQRHSLLLGDPEYKIALQLPLVAEAFEGNPTTMPLEEYLQENAQDQYTWATSQESNQPTSDGTGVSTGGGGPTTLPDFQTFLNNTKQLQSRFALFGEVVEKGDDTDLETFFQRTTRRFYGPNYTKDNLDFVTDSLLDRFSKMGGK